MDPETEILRIVLLPMSITGLPEPLEDTERIPCFAASCVVRVEVKVYALTAAAMLVATSLALTPPELEMLKSPSTSAQETPVLTELSSALSAKRSVSLVTAPVVRRRS